MFSLEILFCFLFFNTLQQADPQSQPSQAFKQLRANGFELRTIFFGDLKDSRTGAIPLNHPPLSILSKEFCILELNLEPTLFTQTHISTCFNSLWTFQPLPSTARILCFSFIIEEYSSLRDFYRPLDNNNNNNNNNNRSIFI